MEYIRKFEDFTNEGVKDYLYGSLIGLSSILGGNMLHAQTQQPVNHHIEQPTQIDITLNGSKININNNGDLVKQLFKKYEDGDIKLLSYGSSGDQNIAKKKALFKHKESGGNPFGYDTYMIKTSEGYMCVITQ